MNKRMFALCVSLLVLISLSSAAGAGVPDPPTSTVEASGDGICSPDAAMCVGGDFDHVTVSIVLRDAFEEPLEGYMVVVSPVQITGATYLCAGEESKTVGPTAGDGTAAAHFTSLGGCGTIHFSATVNTVEIGPSNVITVISPDLDCNGQVTIVDFGRFAFCYLTSDQCCDFDCNGNVDLVDFGRFALHYLHGCLY